MVAVLKEVGGGVGGGVGGEGNGARGVGDEKGRSVQED